MGMKIPLAIGIENYKKIIDKPYYYVDKTLIMKDLIDKGTEVILFTRPRRFGKTLMLSTIKTFFEDEIDLSGTKLDNCIYFKGMKIMQEDERYTSQLGKYPVIFLSLKSAKQPDFALAYQMLIEQISSEFKRHQYVLDSELLLEDERERFHSIMQQKAGQAVYVTALKFLSECLKKYHGADVIILIDEYDVPLENAYFRGFYEQMIDFFRSFLESALKTNDNLKFAVVTGCLRVSKESIFTGLNNFKVISVLDAEYAEYFGFTQAEMEAMLGFYGISEKMQEVKEWYDGFLFGRTEVYNPWSLINYVNDIVKLNSRFPKAYWSNTSSNSIVRELVELADSGVRKEIEELIADGTIEKPVHEEITYEDVHQSQDNLWNFLFFTGYLKMTGERFEVDTVYLTLAIPNEEIRYIYRNTIREWFNQKLKQTDLTDFYDSLLNGKSQIMTEVISKQLAESISYYDNAEAFYHGYLVGILSGLEGYEITSNKEAGEGRPDIVLSPFNPLQPAIIVELKRVVKFTQMEAGCDMALTQIEEKRYDAALLDMGYRHILKYGICFCRKTCLVKVTE